MINLLPQHWVLVPLKEIAKVEWGNTSITKKSYLPEGFPAFSATGQDGFLNHYEWEGPAVVLSAIGARCGKCFRADGKWTAIKNTIIIQGNPVFIDHQLLFHYLNDEKRWDISGTGQPFITLGTAKEVVYPLPPLNEQRRIAAKLEILLGLVEMAQARLATIPRILKRFRQSVLAAACSGRLTADWREENPKVERATITIEKLKTTAGSRVRRGVPESVQVSDLVVDWELPEKWAAYSTAELLRCGAFVDVKDGNHGANHPKVSDFSKVGLPFITAAQVNNYRIDYEGAYKLSGEPLDRIRVGFAKSGDVIYTHKGSVGRVAVADRDCVLTPQTTYYRVNPDIFSNRFVMFYLASHAFSEQVNVVKEQTTRDFVPISEQYLLFHRLPPIAEQQEIVRRVEALFKTADALEARYRTAKAHVDKLAQSILARAFRGELVPKNPNDEPASVLLERIKQSRESVSSPKSKRKAVAALL